MKIDQKFFDQTVKNYLEFIQDKVSEYPMEKQLEIVAVISQLRKIKLDNLSEQDWKTILLANKIFAETPYKQDMINIFRYTNDLFLDD